MENLVFFREGFPDLLQIFNDHTFFFIKICDPAGDQIERKILQHFPLRFHTIGTPFIVIVHFTMSYVDNICPVGREKAAKAL